MVSESFASEEYFLVRIPHSHSGDSTLREYMSSEYIQSKCNDGYDVIVSSSDLNILKQRYKSIEILHSDYEAYIEKKLIENKFSGDHILEEKYFKFGSMSGFFTLEEIYSQFDKMIAKFPQYFKSYEIIGKSIEGRDIVAYNFGSSQALDVPSVLITSLHHAREALGMMSVVYFMWKILENAENGDREAQYLLNNRRISVIPVINPDGYAFNQTKYPNGGGMWRKNRRLNGDSTYGVDINRNYGPDEFWSKDNDFASKSTRSETYKGTAPFSEPETQAVKKFCEDNHFDIALNYHSLGNLLIYPYSSLTKETSDSTIYRYLAENCSKVNEYYYGLDINTVNYNSQGTSDDWMYLKSEKKDKIFSMTPEVGRLTDQYWLSNLSGEERADRLLEICYENYSLNLEALWSAGANIRIRDMRISPKQGDTGQYLVIELVNCGIEKSSADSRLTFSNTDISIADNDVLIGALAPGESKIFINDFTLANNMRNGDSLAFWVNINNGLFERRDTIGMRGYRPVELTLFNSPADTTNWIMNSWGLQSDKEGTENYLTDSPGSDYPLNSNNALILKEPVDLHKVNAAELEFTAKWFIDLEYDIVKFEASTDLGMSWVALISKRMTKGQGFDGSTHTKGLEALTGVNPLWTRQIIDLTGFKGNDLLLRIVLQSGKQIVKTGILFRDIKVLLYNDLPDDVAESNDDLISNKILIPQGEIHQIYLPEIIPLGNVKIFDILGRELRAEERISLHTDYLEINSGEFLPGIYNIVIGSSLQNYRFYKIMVN
jgi:carboxypeptidase T